MRNSANSFLFSAVRVFNTFNTFNRFSTKCCTMIFVILTDFQQFNKFSTKLSTFFLVLFLRIYVKKKHFSTFQPCLLRLLQQVIYIYTPQTPLEAKRIGVGVDRTPCAHACALRARVRARNRSFIL